MGAVAALAAALTWAFASLLFERFGRSAGGLALNLVKCTAALALFVPTLWVVRGTPWPTGMSIDQLGVLALSGLVGLAIGDTFWFLCLLKIGARRALLLFTLAPPMTAAAGALVLNEPFTASMLAAMAVTLAGVGWVISERAPSNGGTPDPGVDRIGVFFGIVSAACQAVGTVLTKVGGSGFPALDVSVVRLTAGTLGLLIVTAALGRLRRAAAPFTTPRSTAAVLGATFLGTYLGVWLMNAGFLLGNVGVAATMNAMSPIFVLPIAALTLGERPSPRAIAGAVVAVAGVALLFVASGGHGT